MTFEEEVIFLLNHIINKEKHLMATLQDIANAVAAETSVDNSIVALLNNIVAELKAAQASNDPVAMATVVSNIEANTAILQAAVTANTPAAPAPVAPAA